MSLFRLGVYFCTSVNFGKTFILWWDSSRYLLGTTIQVYRFLNLGECEQQERRYKSEEYYLEAN